MKRHGLAGLGSMLLVGALGSPPAHAAGGSFQAWFRSLGPLLEDSPALLAAAKEIEAAEHGIEAAIRQAPFSLDSNLAYTHFVTGIGANFVPGSPIAVSSGSTFDVQATSRLSFGLRERLLAQLEGSVGFLGVMEGESFDARNLPFSLGLSLRYDLVRGGSGSSENDRARSQAVLELGGKLRGWARILELELELQSLGSALYANACKHRGLDALAERARRARAEAEIQKGAKVLSQTDLLNFRFLESSVEARLAALVAEREELKERLLGLGEDVREKTLAGLGAIGACDPDLQTLRGLQAPGWGVLERVAADLPGTAAPRALQLALVFSREAQDTELLPGLSPFVSGRFARPNGFQDEVAAVTGGLAFDWAIPGVKGYEALAAAQERHRAAERESESARLRALGELRAMLARVQTRQRLLEVLEVSARDAAALVEILDVRRSIGDIDALNLASAVASSLDARFSLIDAAVELEATLLRIETYQRAAEASARELARLTLEAWTE